MNRRPLLPLCVVLFALACVAGHACVQYALDAGVGSAAIVSGFGVLVLAATGLIHVLRQRSR